MKIEDLVLTIDQCKHLQKLGLDMSDSALVWACGEISFNGITVEKQGVVSRDSGIGKYQFIKEIIPTYTLQEILDKLPKRFEIERFLNNDTSIFVRYGEDTGNLIYHTIDTEKELLTQAYEMLCWLIGNGYFKKG